MRKIGKKGEAGFESEFRKLARIRSPAAAAFARRLLPVEWEQRMNNALEISTEYRAEIIRSLQSWLSRGFERMELLG